MMPPLILARLPNTSSPPHFHLEVFNLHLRRLRSAAAGGEILQLLHLARLSDLLEVSCLLLLPLGHPLLLNLASVRRQLFVTRPN